MSFEVKVSEVAASKQGKSRRAGYVFFAVQASVAVAPQQECEARVRVQGYNEKNYEVIDVSMWGVVDHTGKRILSTRREVLETEYDSIRSWHVKDKTAN